MGLGHSAIAVASPLVALAVTAGIPDDATRWRAWQLPTRPSSSTGLTGSGCRFDRDADGRTEPDAREVSQRLRHSVAVAAFPVTAMFAMLAVRCCCWRTATG